MTEENLPVHKSFFRRFWLVGLIIVIGLGAIWAVMTFVVHPKGSDSGNSIIDKVSDAVGKYPACPSNLAGTLTYQLMDPKYIAAMIPLGNVAPPGHTSPVDHIYFTVNSDDQIPLYAPANGWISHIMANSTKKDANSDYVFDSYVVTYTICDGLVLDFAGYTDVIQPLKDELAKHQDSCKSGIQKVGHDSAGEQQCDYQSLNIKVTSGEQIGWTERTKDANGNYNMPFEIWAANYNKPSRSDVNWDKYYNDNRYAHSMCTFDLYTGDLKSQFDAKFGHWQQDTIKGSKGNAIMLSTGTFTSRTVQPVCGTVNQDVVGTLQGMWFSHAVDKNDKSGNIGATGQGLAFLHNNIDPTKGEVSIGGEFNNAVTGVYVFTPTHAGTINREPSEVKADGQIYCYDSNDKVPNYGQGQSGKILVQLLDDHHIKADHQSGTCTTNETFKNTYNFER